MDRSLQQPPAARRSLILLSPAFALIGVFGLAPLGLNPDLFLPGPRHLWRCDLGILPNAYIQFLFERDIFDGTLEFNASYLQIGARFHHARGLCRPGVPAERIPDRLFHRDALEGIRNILDLSGHRTVLDQSSVRTFSMMLILRDEGPMNAALLGIGITEDRSHCCTPTLRSASACSTATCLSWCCPSTPAWSDRFQARRGRLRSLCQPAGECCNAS